MSKIQSVVFFENYGWTPIKARSWLKKNKLIPIKVVDKHLHGELRYRIRNPKLFDHFITKKIEPGLDLIIGYQTKKRY